MQRRMYRTWAILFALMVIGGTISVAAVYQNLTYAQSPASPGAPRAEVRPRRVIELDEPEWRHNVPLQALASESRIIAIGVPLRNICSLAPNGQITTDYQVNVQEVVKGNVEPNEIISVKMPGGVVIENDGSLLEGRTRQVRKMQNGKRYILFLKNAPGSHGSFVPLRGSQGLYEIPLNRTRVNHLGRSFLLPPADDGEEISAFLQAVRFLAR